MLFLKKKIPKQFQKPLTISTRSIPNPDLCVDARKKYALCVNGSEIRV